MKKLVSNLGRRVRRMHAAGILVGIVVDLLVMAIIPGSSIIEAILAFLAGLSAGVAFMRKRGNVAPAAA